MRLHVNMYATRGSPVCTIDCTQVSVNFVDAFVSRLVSGGNIPIRLFTLIPTVLVCVRCRTPAQAVTAGSAQWRAISKAKKGKKKEYTRKGHSAKQADLSGEGEEEGGLLFFAPWILRQANELTTSYSNLSQSSRNISWK